MINIQTVICQVLAQAAPATPAAAGATVDQPSPWSGIIMMLLMFAGMWFLLIAPQRKRQKEMEKLQNDLTSPWWFIGADLGLAYLPMALGGRWLAGQIFGGGE